MATTPHRNIAAGEDLSANKDRFVKFDGSDLLVAADAASKPIGIQTNKPASGETVGLAEVGETGRLKIGATVTAGDYLKPDANALGIPATGAGNFYGAMALESGVANDIINVDVLVPATFAITP